MDEDLKKHLRKPKTRECNTNYHACPFQVEIHGDDDPEYCDCTEEEEEECESGI
mgnify:CR=1 FL=1